MAAKKDVFGFEELEKALDKMRDKYPSEVDAVLSSIASQAAKRLRQVAPVNKNSAKKTGKSIKKSYRAKKPKTYNPGGHDVSVSYIENNAPHFHLVELGHDVYTTGGRAIGKVTRYNRAGLRAMGVKKHNRVEGRFTFPKVWKEIGEKVMPEIQKCLDEITKEMQ